MDRPPPARPSLGIEPAEGLCPDRGSNRDLPAPRWMLSPEPRGRRELSFVGRVLSAAPPATRPRPRHLCFVKGSRDFECDSPASGPVRGYVAVSRLFIKKKFRAFDACPSVLCVYLFTREGQELFSFF